MKSKKPVASNVARDPAAPLVPVDEKTAPAKPAVSIGVDRQVSQMEQTMKEMQQQMN